MENNVIYIDIEKTIHTANGNLKLSVKTSIESGNLVALFGNSGAGKTTILRILAGLVNPDKGVVKYGETIWFDSSKKINISPQKRAVSLMFQDYALFPNMTVEENIQFAQFAKDNIVKDELIKIFGLEELKKRKPTKLSGGQKQRVALARALARKPKLLLLDEPLSALDSEMRNNLQMEILRAHKLLNATTIMVSHDLSEVFRLSDKVYCIENGGIKREGKPEDVFLDNSISGKVQITGQIAHIAKQDVTNIVTVISNNNQILKVVAFDNDLENLAVGDNVMVYTKAFNPIISKLK